MEQLYSFERHRELLFINGSNKATGNVQGIRCPRTPTVSLSPSPGRAGPAAANNGIRSDLPGGTRRREPRPSAPSRRPPFSSQPRPGPGTPPAGPAAGRGLSPRTHRNSPRLPAGPSESPPEGRAGPGRAEPPPWGSGSTRRTRCESGPGPRGGAGGQGAAGAGGGAAGRRDRRSVTASPGRYITCAEYTQFYGGKKAGKGDVGRPPASSGAVWPGGPEETPPAAAAAGPVPPPPTAG